MSMVFRRSWIALSLAVLVALSGGRAQDGRPVDLTELSLEALMNITVTSVSKKEESLANAAAAIFVITQEDLVRSGVTSIPEALRMVPGLQVAQIDANKWAISSRGFNGRFANKLLVLIDGRSVYTPLFSGVYWDVQDLPLEEIERIEVIRGPGATLWGSNAVNGVINIISKQSGQTAGGLVTAGAGTENRGFGSLRYGGTIGQTGATYRLYGRLFDWDNLRQRSGVEANDGWNTVRGGSRVDWNAGDADAFTLQGDLYRGSLRQSLELPSFQFPFTSRVIDSTRFAGGNVIGRWNRRLGESSSMMLQAYYDRTYRQSVLVRENRHTVDLEFQHGFRISGTNEAVWGVSYRLTGDELTGGVGTSFGTPERKSQLFSGFIQNHATLLPSRLFLTFGAKLEHNDFTGAEFQPNARLLWTPSRSHSLWSAVSRAARTPSRAEADVRINFAIFPDTSTGTMNVITVSGSDRFRSEQLTAYELGYRFQGSDHYSVDLAGFVNRYDDLRTAGPVALPWYNGAGTPPHVVIPFGFGNAMAGETYGVEIAGNWHPVERWRLAAGYTWFRGVLRTKSFAPVSTTPDELGNSPSHQFNLRSSLTVVPGVDVDGALYYVDRLSNQQIPSYVRVDARVGWSITRALGLSVTAQNILKDRHQEFGTTELGEVASDVQRSVYGKLSFRF